uniref:SET domain-containing protein n=1 Tax=Macrostomum lignano TaxID=282301 RepID=A0A1I8FM41_9PLAT
RLLQSRLSESCLATPPQVGVPLPVPTTDPKRALESGRLFSEAPVSVASALSELADDHEGADSFGVQIGTAICLSASVLDHSCQPNVHALFPIRQTEFFVSIVRILFVGEIGDADSAGDAISSRLADARHALAGSSGRRQLGRSGDSSGRGATNNGKPFSIRAMTSSKTAMRSGSGLILQHGHAQSPANGRKRKWPETVLAMLATGQKVVDDPIYLCDLGAALCSASEPPNIRAILEEARHSPAANAP